MGSSVPWRWTSWTTVMAVNRLQDVECALASRVELEHLENVRSKSRNEDQSHSAGRRALPADAQRRFGRPVEDVANGSRRTTRRLEARPRKISLAIPSLTGLRVLHAHVVALSVERCAIFRSSLRVCDVPLFLCRTDCTPSRASGVPGPWMGRRKEATAAWATQLAETSQMQFSWAVSAPSWSRRLVSTKGMNRGATVVTNVLFVCG